MKDITIEELDELLTVACRDRNAYAADLRLPDGGEVLNVPYHDQTFHEPGDGSSWCRPWISSMTVR